MSDDDEQMRHFPIGVTIDGMGPRCETDDDYDHTECWCGDVECERWREP